MYCGSCGRKVNDETARFCSTCGASITPLPPDKVSLSQDEPTKVLPVGRASARSTSWLAWFWLLAIFAAITYYARTSNVTYAIGMLLVPFALGALIAIPIWIARRFTKGVHWRWYHWLNATAACMLGIIATEEGLQHAAKRVIAAQSEPGVAAVNRSPVALSRAAAAKGGRIALDGPTNYCVSGICLGDQPTKLLRASWEPTEGGPDPTVEMLQMKAKSFVCGYASIGTLRLKGSRDPIVEIQLDPMPGDRPNGDAPFQVSSLSAEYMTPIPQDQRHAFVQRVLSEHGGLQQVEGAAEYVDKSVGVKLQFIFWRPDPANPTRPIPVPGVILLYSLDKDYDGWRKLMLASRQACKS